METQREHLTHMVCWCRPIVRQSCPDCENGEGLEGVSAVIKKAPFIDCWRCDGHGFVEPLDQYDGPLIIVHRNIEA